MAPPATTTEVPSAVRRFAMAATRYPLMPASRSALDCGRWSGHSSTAGLRAIDPEGRKQSHPAPDKMFPDGAVLFSH